MNNQEIKELLDRYVAGNCSPNEKALVERFYMEQVQERKFSGDPEDLLEKGASMWGNISAHIDSDQRKPNPYKFNAVKLSAAAAVLIVIGVAFYFYQSPVKKQNVLTVPVPQYATDIKPGGNKAILTLANGKQVILDEAKDGVLISQSGMTIRKSGNGQLVYQINAGSQPDGPVLYHTISTPKGGEYQITLPDGTHIWLNAASSLRFPDRFKGKERNVELKGEGYFEVAKNKAMPFKVKTGNQMIQVLGTHFNVKAYEDEASYKTTLLEGSVKVYSGKQGSIIKPGEQAKVSKEEGDQIRIAQVDVEEEMAWKNNKLIFNSKPLKDIMRSVSRWYNVEVIYEGQIAEKVFTGTISRYENVSEVLKMLESTNLVHFKIEERRITVMP
ncbi:FecR family protein [Pedobacter caeni]|uniref:FecR family protein n=1 Tax=Pedobacter caeni TaxID=288992 RepID=A0A1M5IRQ5_9SPHI|nr:FecR family protein [Pedobacter caeni]SHG30905.1 FecR family protein [Pedobacter caeni]